jgi:hypothetical protein
MVVQHKGYQNETQVAIKTAGQPKSRVFQHKHGKIQEPGGLILIGFSRNHDELFEIVSDLRHPRDKHIFAAILISTGNQTNFSRADATN